MAPIPPTPPPPDLPRIEAVEVHICPPRDVECWWEKINDILETTANAVNPEASVSSQLSAMPSGGFGTSFGSSLGNS
jgi:hypothetical protein